MLKPIIALIQALSSNTRPQSVAHAVSIGFLLGFVPKDNLLWYVLFIFFLFMNIQRSVYALCLILGSILGALLDPVFDSVGWVILTVPSFESFFVRILEIPFVAYTKFNNTIVAGSLALGIVFYIPLYWLARLFIFIWRKYIAEGVRKLKLVKLLKQIPLVSKLIEMVQGVKK